RRRHTRFSRDWSSDVCSSDLSLVDVMANPPSETLKGARSYLLLYQLTSTEEHILHQVGMATTAIAGFRLDGHGFTTAFSNRLQRSEERRVGKECRARGGRSR